MMELQAGAERAVTSPVTPSMSAECYGNGGFPVLATPALLGLFEHCAIQLLAPHLPSGMGSVGTKAALEHLAATPLGVDVTVTARLTTVDRKRLVFALEAHDPNGLIARCDHERYLVNQASFVGKLDALAGG